MNAAQPPALLRGETRWILWTAVGLAAYGLLFTLYTLFQPLGERGRLIVGDLAYIPSSLIAGALCLLVLRATRDRRLRWAWGLIGLGFISWAVADTLWVWSELALSIVPESPHLTDVPYLLMYPLFFAGLLVYPTVRWNWLNRTKLLLDVSVISAAIAVFGWYYLLAPIVTTEAESALGRAIELAYPLGDLILIWALARIYFAAPRTSASATILMLMAGIGLNVTADVWYAFLSAQDLYYTGHFVDALWVLGSVSAGGAALSQYRVLRQGLWPSSLSSEQTIRRSQQVLPYLILVPVLILVHIGTAAITTNVRERGLIVGAMAMVGFIITRQIVIINENIRLNAELAQRVEEVIRLNEQMQRVNEELRRIDQFKSEFVSNVSHELRTPLTNILGYAELLLDSSGGPLTSFQSESLRTVHSNGHRLLGLVNDLLDVSRLEAGRFTISTEPVAPAPLIRGLSEEMRLLANQKNLALAIDLPDDLPVILADGSRMAQVLGNLLSNAIKFTPPHGCVAVRAYELESGSASGNSQASPLFHPAPDLPAGKWLIVSVEDTGPGIPAEEQPRLFYRFHRTAEAKRLNIQGTGLGLYVAKVIVEAHGGRIGVTSQVGQGSTFWFALPAEADGFIQQSDKERRNGVQPEQVKEGAVT
ncbi:MAG: hypothetical protein IT330_05190 [Anaerolineae bacterium]|nr:hypothetical protein [Anaerolineae bacterium]